jgi:DegV family protein with EDD domain
MTMRIVTDGAADLPDALVSAADITVVKGPVHLGGAPWHGNPDQFWEELGKGTELPATDAPSVEQLAGAYAGERPVLAVHVSAELSRTFQHAEAGAAGSAAPVHLVDSRSLSVGTGLVALAAAEAVQAGTAAERVAAMADRWVDQLHLHAMIDDARFLVHGGRAGLVAARVGRHAHRHVVAVKGHVIPIRQLRHRSDALKELIEHVGQHVLGGVAGWAVGHGDAPDVDQFVARLAAIFGSDPSFVTLLGAPVGSHMGPRSLVVAFFSET